MDIVDEEMTEGPLQPPDLVEINKEFNLFLPTRTNNEPNRGDSLNTSFKLRANLPNNEVIPVYVYTSPLTSGTLESLLTPFDPEQGHTIDQRDFDYKAREKMAKEQKDDPDDSKEIEEELGLHMLDIECRVNGLGKDSNGFVLPSDSPLNSLRLVLFFPSGVAVEARPKALAIKINPTIHFPSFYPVDARPLATKTSFDMVGDSILTEGLHLAVPDDPKELYQIRGLFFKSNQPSS